MLTRFKTNVLKLCSCTNLFLFSENTANKVFFQHIPEGQSSEEILLAAVVAGTTPDIYSNIWQGLVDFYSQSGKFQQVIQKIPRLHPSQVQEKVHRKYTF